MSFLIFSFFFFPLSGSISSQCFFFGGTIDSSNKRTKKSAEPAGFGFGWWCCCYCRRKRRKKNHFNLPFFLVVQHVNKITVPHHSPHSFLSGIVPSSSLMDFYWLMEEIISLNTFVLVFFAFFPSTPPRLPFVVLSEDVWQRVISGGKTSLCGMGWLGLMRWPSERSIGKRIFWVDMEWLLEEVLHDS